MTWINLHTHTTFSDGAGEPLEYVLEAGRRGLPGIGFSDHAPLPIDAAAGRAMKIGRLAEYGAVIRVLKDRYERRLSIFRGLEIDYIPGISRPAMPRYRFLELDFSIGAVHFAGRDIGGTYWAVDGDEEDFARGLEEIHGGDVRALVRAYYGLVREMIRTGPPDVVAHLDVVKKNNRDGCYFVEDDDWYRQEVRDTLDVIARSPSRIEVNTGGLRRGPANAVYPSPWILEECLAREIPVIVSSDAHRPVELTADFDKAATILAHIGFTEIDMLTNNGWRACPLPGLIVPGPSAPV